MQQANQDNPAAHLAGDLLFGAGESLTSLPLGAHGIVALTLLAGLILWFAGGKVVKPALMAVGIALGAALGMVVLPEIGITQVASIPSPYVGLAGGAILGGVVSALLFRMAITLSAIGAFAAGGLLAGACFLQFAPRLMPPEPAPPPLASNEPMVDLEGLTEELTGGLDAGLARAESIKNELAEHMDPQTRRMLSTAAGQTRQFVQGLVHQTRALWDDLSPRERTILVGGTLAGGVLGLMLGVVMPRKSAAVVTAMAGAGLWLASATWLAHAVEMPGRNILHRSPLAWAAIWLAVSFVGVVVQLGRLKPAASEA